jgi:hypothetical protein
MTFKIWMQKEVRERIKRLEEGIYAFRLFASE